jgi:ribosomal protein S1
LTDQRVKSPGDVLSEQQVVNVKILSVDPATRKIALSLKQASGHHDDDAQLREEDNSMRKLREKFGDGPLKGGIG